MLPYIPFKLIIVKRLQYAKSINFHIDVLGLGHLVLGHLVPGHLVPGHLVLGI